MPWFLLFLFSAWAQRVPDRQIPPSVIQELRILENRFDLELAADCDAERCFSKGCSYIDHAVADRPKSMSLPGLGQDAGPGSTPSQEYLTRARCSFAYEASIETRYVQALSRRLQSKLSKGWMTVSVDQQKLLPLPNFLADPPHDTDEPEELLEDVAAVPTPPWSIGSAARELWMSLLPHFYWMIAVVMVTFAGTLLIWAWRRVGRTTIEEQMMMAEMARGEGEEYEEEEDADDEHEVADETDFVAQQDAAWTARLDALDPSNPDRQLEALTRELLRAGDLPLLAKAALRFPNFHAVFPSGGEVASAKLELAEYLKDVDEDELPSDADFFRRLNRHALSAAVSSQSDAVIVRSLREDFGASGLATLIGRLPARPGALLFALSPADEQHEMVRLLEPTKVAEMAESLLLSNRMAPSETEHLFAVLTAMRNDAPLPPPPSSEHVSDRGSAFEAAGALSVLLESVNPARRAALFGGVLDRFGGSLPAWYRGILVADMLFSLEDEARTDLLLEVDVELLAAWFSLLDSDTKQRLLFGLPDSLRNKIRASTVFPSRPRQLAMAEQGRKDLARGFQLQLARVGSTFERAVAPRPAGDP